MTVQIKEFDRIECDNGKRYEVIPSYNNEFPYALVREGNTVNCVHEYYLTDCFNNDEPICIGEDYKRKLLYTRIIKVFDIRGFLKVSKSE